MKDIILEEVPSIHDDEHDCLENLIHCGMSKFLFTHVCLCCNKFYEKVFNGSGYELKIDDKPQFRLVIDESIKNELFKIYDVEAMKSALRKAFYRTFEARW